MADANKEDENKADTKKEDAKKADAMEDDDEDDYSQLIPPAMITLVSYMFGARGFGIVYKGIISDNKVVAVKVLNGTSNKRIEKQFMAEEVDFGLAKLCNRENTHITMTGGRGTPGYAASELWMPLPITHKCDVYSFGMLLFEIIGRRRNSDTSLGDSQL
ncbi:hypothetical protein M8C21_016237 [Ambrosia artemisiifolia]|uniref:Protein kinase domain-containing protein n=1 Tax=Ambrosia artemisiifolia TaxID=4212 RepID=A0AAD5GK39_AMBAR|nr:hypothetical protein M8C21_016237 [Ambrosia artemisiifolia]